MDILWSQHEYCGEIKSIIVKSDGSAIENAIAQGKQNICNYQFIKMHFLKHPHVSQKMSSRRVVFMLLYGSYRSTVITLFAIFSSSIVPTYVALRTASEGIDAPKIISYLYYLRS